eukprot:TRINITY_DN5231_c0_g1_i2.p1 TRINITY_DN5231_c0_g1~~TRINITY_DN5231_c0_g1_i2.p1  ORF type:complete len:461 (+),score=56.68 TRINITY_DN5231_c0_g1_i2:306-1688(+)
MKAGTAVDGDPSVQGSNLHRPQNEGISPQDGTDQVLSRPLLARELSISSVISERNRILDTRKFALVTQQHPQSREQNDDNDNAPHVTTVRHLLAGAMARVTAATIMSPVDTVKARLQFQGNLKAGTGIRTRYSGAIDAFRTIFRQEGWKAFYKGLPPRLLYITPSAAVSFAIYEQMRRILKDHGIFPTYKHKSTPTTASTSPSVATSATTTPPPPPPSSSSPISPVPSAEEPAHSSSTHTYTPDQQQQEQQEQQPEPKAKNGLLYNPLLPLLAGGCARFIGTACRTPFDIVKARLQVQGSLEQQKYRGTFHAFRTIVHSEGIGGLWTGYASSLMRDVPFASIYFTSYEYCKFAQVRAMEGGKLTAKNHLLAGAGAGCIAAIFTIPFDVVKTRLQTQATLPLEEQRYKGVRDCFSKIYRDEGARGFTRGLWPRLFYLTPSASLIFTFYEQYKNLLGCSSSE